MPRSAFFGVAVFVAAILSSISGSVAQTTPEYCDLLASWGTNIAIPGASVGPLSLCSTAVTSGTLYLISPGNFTFSPIALAQINNNAYLDAAIIPQYFTAFGYGYRVVVAANSNSLATPLVTSGTFAIVDSSFYSSAIANGGAAKAYSLIEPPQDVSSAACGSFAWSSTGEKRLVWNATSSSTTWPNVSVLLYNSANVRLGHLTLASDVPSGSQAGDVSYYYFNYAGALFPGSGYQVVIRPYPDDPTQVLAVSQPISIVNEPVSLPTASYGSSGLPQTTISAPGADPTSSSSSHSSSPARRGARVNGSTAVMAGLCLLLVILSLH